MQRPPPCCLRASRAPLRVASSVFNTSRQLGGALAVAVFGALLAAHGQLLDGVRESLVIAAVVALAAAQRTCCSSQLPTEPPSPPLPPVPAIFGLAGLDVVHVERGGKVGVGVDLLLQFRYFPFS